MKKLFLSSILLLTFQITLGIKQMRPINDWQDVKPFVGNIVAYTTNSYYYSSGGDCYKIDSDSNLNFGFIPAKEPQEWQEWRGDSEKSYGYKMFRIIKKNGISCSCALINDLLENAHMKMRRATVQELVTINQAIKEQKAKLDFMDVGGPVVKEFQLKLQHAEHLVLLKKARL